MESVDSPESICLPDPFGCQSDFRAANLRREAEPKEPKTHHIHRDAKKKKKEKEKEKEKTLPMYYSRTERSF
jgi:hypothetical protein